MSKKWLSIKSRIKGKKDLEEKIKAVSFPDCSYCKGTGFIQWGWGKGLICPCVDEYSMMIIRNSLDK